MDGHFGLAGVYVVDPGAELQRLHDQRRKQNERQERAERWIANRMVGRAFASFEALQTAACAETVAAYDRALASEEHTMITNACRALWSGLSFRSTLAAAHVETVRSNGQVAFRTAA